jgi:ABC-type phosphate transport system substrate-binding protein
MMRFTITRPERGLCRLAALAATACLMWVLGGTLEAESAAALGKQCSGASIAGQGAYLQSPAQSIWTGTGFNSSNALACNGSQGAKGHPKVSFTPLGSGVVLHGWGADDGIFHSKGKGGAFIASDEPPAGPVGETGTALNYMKKALGSDIVVAPVVQTAIAIAAHPPSLPAHTACSVEYITAADLEGVFAGSITNWRQLSTASDSEAGGNCDQAITRVVRSEASGVTYQFKHYLDQVNPEPLPCTGESPKDWAQLQSSREPAELNLIWPRKADCQEGEGPVTVVAAPGEGSAGPLSFVKSNPGTITYADLPTAKEVASEQIIGVHNGSEPVSPSASESEANCSGASYTLPGEWSSGVNVDWSQVYGSDPEIGKGFYPICTLSWVVAAADSGAVFGFKAGTTVRDFLLYANDPEGGQAGIQHHWYAPLPKGVATATEVALSEIGGEGGEEEESGVVLCKATPENVKGVLHCPKGQAHSGAVFGSASSPTQFVSTAGPEGTISCEEAHFDGFFNENGRSIEPGLKELSFTSCASTLPGEPGGSLEFDGGPFDDSRFVYLSSLAPEGAFVIAKSEGGQPLLRFSSEFTCMYQPSFLGGQVVNGKLTTLLLGASWELSEGPEECPSALHQTSELGIGWLKGNLYITSE